VLSELRGKFKEYLMESTVNFNTKLKEAASFGQPISEYDPGSRGYKDFVNLARELMGQRPVEDEPTPMDKLSRPAELVQRAKQLAQLTNVQFGRNYVTDKTAEVISTDTRSLADPVEAAAGIESQPEDVRTPVIGSIAEALERGQGAFGGRFANPGGTNISNISNMSMASVDEELADSSLRMRNGDEMGSSDGPVAVEEATATVAPPITALPVKRTTEQKIEDFYGVRKIGDDVIFAVRFEEARKVLIAGDFNNWSPMSSPMISRGRPGEFWMCMPLARGRYRYRFVVDGKWVTDPNNEYVEANQFGELNNVIEVD
jgi:hypothetical protein